MFPDVAMVMLRAHWCGAKGGTAGVAVGAVPLPVVGCWGGGRMNTGESC